jgi:hypothetical protein
MDQLVVLSVLSAAFTVVAIGFGIAGLAPVVWISYAAGGLILARLSCLAAVASAAGYGDLVRSCFDLFRGDLLTHLGWTTPGSSCTGAARVRPVRTWSTRRVRAPDPPAGAGFGVADPGRDAQHVLLGHCPASTTTPAGLPLAGSSVNAA